MTSHTGLQARESRSAYLGARVISERCRALEAVARKESHPACHASGEGVEELFESSVSALDGHLEMGV